MLGNIRFLRVSYAVLVFVPIIIVISVKLPFSLLIGYFASLFLSVAHMIYQWRCPEIIKRFDSPNDLYRDMLEIKALQKQYLPVDTKFDFDIVHCRENFTNYNTLYPVARLICSVLYFDGIIFAAGIIFAGSDKVLDYIISGVTPALVEYSGLVFQACN